MKKNEANVDRVVRVLFAVAVALLYLLNVVSGTLALVLGIAAVVLLATGLVGFCPLYALLGISTKKTVTPV